MIAKKSPLEFSQFYILASDYSFVDSSFEEVKPFEEYEIEIDFTKNEKENGEFLVYTRIAVNQSKEKLPGHSLNVEGVGVFKITDNDLSDDVVLNLKTMSPITMMISSIRGYIMNITSYTPLGKYILPSLDITGILQTKASIQRKKRAARKIKEITN